MLPHVNNNNNNNDGNFVQIMFYKYCKTLLILVKATIFLILNCFKNRCYDFEGCNIDDFSLILIDEKGYEIVNFCIN